MKRRALLASLPLWAGAAAAQPLQQPAGGALGVSSFPVGDYSSLRLAQLGIPRTGPPGATLDLSFLTPGALPPGVTFTRAGTATYCDATGTIQTAAANAPRWDYDPASHVLRGLLIEEARTNIWLQSGDASNAAWAPSFVGASTAPVVTGHQIAAPDGTMSGARVAYPVGTQGAGSSYFTQQWVLTANQYTFDVWLKGTVGGERIYLSATPDGVLYYRTAAILTTQWQRFTLTTPALTAALWYFSIGYDGRDAGQPSVPAQTVYVWGAQLEQGAFGTSYIPTTAAAVTRAEDFCSVPVGAWYSAAASTLFAESMHPVPPANNFWQAIVSIDDGIITNRAQIYRVLNSNNVASQVTPTYNPTLGALTPGAVVKAAAAFQNNNQLSAMNGVTSGASAVATTMTGVNTLNIGHSGNGTPLDGYIRRVRYWPRVLSAAELQQVTT